jgi:E3 ubiquitin-protein ligase RNF14
MEGTGPATMTSTLITTTTTTTAKSLNSESLILLQQCGICFEEKPQSEFIKACSDGHEFCMGCLNTFSEMHIQAGTIEDLKCPCSDCGKQIHLNVIKKVTVKAEVFDRFERLQMNRCLDNMPDVQYCPNKECRSPVIVSLRKHQGTCSNCKLCFCIRCHEEPHFGPCLMSSSKQNKLAEETFKWIQTHTRQCQNCFIFIEKNGGCNHMFCLRCQKPFLWGEAKFDKNRPALPINEKTREIIPIRKEEQIRLEVGLSVIVVKRPKISNQNSVKRCPNCSQALVRKTSLNHISCTNCKTKVCYECVQPIKSIAHYLPPGKCRQHSAL